ncbi:hypothetical protein ACFYUD_14165 [Nocardia tengchongensis]|uniref:hypothetical protein n=1 Tax=Nocardia tengchongensis TaxID=2055889 RepID=UPI0036CEB340
MDQHSNRAALVGGPDIAIRAVGGRQTGRPIHRASRDESTASGATNQPMMLRRINQLSSDESTSSWWKNRYDQA